jgi:hypothetical protein
MGGAFVANSPQGEAMAFERHIKDQAQDKPWLGEKQISGELLTLLKLGSTLMALHSLMASSVRAQWNLPALLWETLSLLNLTPNFLQPTVNNV